REAKPGEQQVARQPAQRDRGEIGPKGVARREGERLEGEERQRREPRERQDRERRAREETRQSPGGCPAPPRGELLEQGYEQAVIDPGCRDRARRRHHGRDPDAEPRAVPDDHRLVRHDRERDVGHEGVREQGEECGDHRECERKIGAGETGSGKPDVGSEMTRGARVYSYRRASTGSSRAARTAGYRPNKMPVIAAAPSAATTDPTGTWARTGVATAITNAIRPPAIIPATPPASVSVAASTRNCHRISRRVAPSALRTPISRVRSVTEIIMIATTPTPPTMSPTIDRATITMRSICVMLLMSERYCSCDTTAKLLF